MPSILDTTNMEFILPEKLFKKSDVKPLFKACKHVMDDELFGNRDGYHSFHVSLDDCKELAKSEGISLKDSYRAIRDKWERNHPEEAKKEFDSQTEWEKEHQRNLNILFRIAKRNGLFFVYDKNTPDTIKILKDHKSIYRICIL